MTKVRPAKGPELAASLTAWFALPHNAELVERLRAVGLRLANPDWVAPEADALGEGGDCLWLDERTLAVGLGYRTNAAGVAQLREAVGPEVEVVTVELPY
jgi:N-dimethylarginine dimethylaminohydrolase